MGHIGGEAGVSFIIKGVTITVKLYGPPSASNVMNSFKPKGVVRNSTYKCSRPKRWLKYSHSHKPVVSKTLEKGYHFQLSIFVCSAYCCGQKTTNTNIQEYGNLLGKAIFQGSSSRSEKKISNNLNRQGGRRKILYYLQRRVRNILETQLVQIREIFPQ